MRPPAGLLHPDYATSDRCDIDDPLFEGADEPTDLTRSALDFIDLYADYADVLEAPRSMHEAVALQLIGAILNRNGVTIPHGAICYTLDVWEALISESGHGRSTVIGMPAPILQAAGLDSILVRTQWGSPQALYQGFSERPSGLYSWGELSERLIQLNDRSFGGAKQWLTDRYDNLEIPDEIVFRQTGRSARDTPTIHFSSSPRINILATSSEEWFFNTLAQADSAGGFLPRWMLIRATGSTRVIPTPSAPDSNLVIPLAQHLRRIFKLTGPADISAILPQYDGWYRQAKVRFEAQPNRALAAAYFNRHRVHIIKLAVICEASSSATLRVSEKSWSRAVAMAADLERGIFSLLPTGMSREGYQLDKRAEKVRDAGVEGLPLSAFTRAFQHDNRMERYHRLETMTEAETVYCFQRGTTGRPAIYLVHRDFVDAYRSRHPGDVALESAHRPRRDRY